MEISQKENAYYVGFNTFYIYILSAGLFPTIITEMSAEITRAINKQSEKQD